MMEMKDKKEIKEKKFPKIDSWYIAPAINNSVKIAQWNIKGAITAITEFTSPLVQNVLKETAVVTALASTLAKVSLSYTSNVSALGNVLQTVVSTFEKIRYTPIWDILNQIKDFDFSKYRKELDNIYLQELIKAKWFPVHVSMVTVDFFVDIVEVLQRTKPTSKNRIAKLDKVFFNYYNEYTLNELKKFWKTRDIPSCTKRILSDAIQAYKRRQYALTVSALVPLWQGLIEEKAIGKQERKSDKRTKQEFKELITVNDCNNFVEHYFKEYIFYECNSLAEVKDDVPGRHGVCHSWYNNYPSRKTALNAIIFTDFLLELEPVKKEKKDG